MSTSVKPSWMASRLPGIGLWRARLTSPMLPPRAPYLAALPWLITAALVFLTASGFVLAVYYNPAHAFDSLQFIDRNVNNGWLIHSFHETGATMIFGLVYLLLLRDFLLGSYRAPGELVWLFRVLVFALLLFVGWLGFTLTGGAMSYWSLNGAANGAAGLTGVPGALGTWFFGGPNGADTLGRVVVFHIVLALAIFGVLALHAAARNAVAVRRIDRAAVGFHPYYTAQYFAALVVFALIFAVLVFFAPHFGESPMNALPANPMVVPGKIFFPWYLAPIAGLGDTFPGAFGGIFGVLAGLGVVFILPWLDRSRPERSHGWLYRALVGVLALDVLGLGWAANSDSGAAGILLIVFTFWYFIHFLLLTPIVTAMEAE